MVFSFCKRPSFAAGIGLLGAICLCASHLPAESFRGAASATIQVTATVVASTGISLPSVRSTDSDQPPDSDWRLWQPGGRVLIVGAIGRDHTGMISELREGDCEQATQMDEVWDEWLKESKAPPESGHRTLLIINPDT